MFSVAMLRREVAIDAIACLGHAWDCATLRDWCELLKRSSRSGDQGVQRNSGPRIDAEHFVRVIVIVKMIRNSAVVEVLQLSG